MKKKIGLILVLFIALFTLTGCGKSGKDYYAKYNHLNFKETLDAEEMQIENTEYTESEKEGNFELRYIPLEKVEKELIKNRDEYGDIHGVAREMLEVLKVYKNKHKTS